MSDDASCRSAQREKIALLIIAALAIGGMIAIALIALDKSDKVNSESATLIGVVVTGLVAFSKDAIQAVRAFWQDDRLGKMTDQIAASAPATVGNDALSATPAGTPEDPVNVTEVKP